MRWMPTRLYPCLANGDGDLVVEIECEHGGSTCWRLSNDLGSVSAPMKVIGPLLRAWIEQDYCFLGLRIVGLGLDALEIVAEAAGEPEVVFLIAASGPLRMNVLDFQPAQDKRLRTQAIATTVSCLDSHAVAKFFRRPAHADNGSLSPRRTASRKAWALLSIIS
jgi:hypothetical protein